MIEKKIQIVPGFSWFGKNIGIKDETLDFGGILADVPCQAAGVFTRNTMPGAPVLVGREHLRDGRLQAVIVNSKNANVATMQQGVEDSRRICRLVAESCGIAPELVLPSSTGVIGRRLPMEQGAALWDALWAAGTPHGLIPAGIGVYGTTGRLEKGYRVGGADIGPEADPYQSGLGFCVKLDKTDFIGRETLAAAKAAGPPVKRLRCLVLDDPRSVCLGNEPVRFEGQVVGRVATGGYGFAVERSIAYAYLPTEHAAFETHLDVDVFGTWVGATVSREPLYDPTGEHIRA